MKNKIEKLVSNSDWKVSIDNTFLLREYVFNNFIEAFSWMTEVAITAEKINHHPEWKNVYNTIEVKLMTHDTNGITDLDIKLAYFMDKYFVKYILEK